MEAKFKFNDRDVCTNPHVIERVFAKPYFFSFHIETAQDYKGYWIMGYSIGFRNGSGMGVPCSRKYNAILFNNEQDAVWAAYKVLKSYMYNHRVGTSSSEADMHVVLWEPFMMEALDEAAQPKLF